MSEETVNIADFRRALGCFATGVAVATTLDSAGKRAGITISSFNSVSLDPPLVLFSIGKDSQNYDTFVGANHFAVNVLSMGQIDLSTRFATKGIDKFEGIVCRDGIGGVPVLPDYAACFECRTEHCYDGGDHKIIVGRVMAFEDRESDPLIFYRGHFLDHGAPST